MNAESSGNSFRAQVLHGKTPPLVVTDKERRHEGEDILAADLVSRSETRSCNHRLKDRHRLSDEKATVLHEGRIIPVEVINLSDGGAMIRGDFEPKLWEIIELQLGDGFGIEVAVRWLKDDRIGVEFAHETRIECEPEQRDALLLEVIRRSFDDQDVQFAPDEDFGPEAREGGRDAGNRRQSRHPLIWLGQIHYAHDSNPVRLRNISEGGALVDVTTDYPEGAEVMLDLGEAGQFFATVARACGDQAGLRFHDPFDLACLARAKPQLMPTNWQAPTYLDAEGDSPWNDNWSRSSLAEIATELEGYLKR
jgi:hypothetical protein